MDVEEVMSMLRIVGGIAGIHVVLVLILYIAFRMRGPAQSKVISTLVVGSGERFDWTVLAEGDGRHVLWLRFDVEFDGSDEDDVSLRLRMKVDDAPERAYLFNCEGDPGDASMKAAWASTLSSSGGQGTFSCTAGVCDLHAQPAGTPVRLQGVVLCGPNVRSGQFELRFSRR